MPQWRRNSTKSSTQSPLCHAGAAPLAAASPCSGRPAAPPPAASPLAASALPVLAAPARLRARTDCARSKACFTAGTRTWSAIGMGQSESSEALTHRISCPSAPRTSPDHRSTATNRGISKCTLALLFLIDANVRGVSASAWMSMPNSSRNSRESASSGDSPSSTLPPGNSHCPAIDFPCGLCAKSTRGSSPPP
eukprot:scaffold11075_cov132-Isochrysis_galbana.AAC.3